MVQDVMRDRVWQEGRVVVWVMVAVLIGLGVLGWMVVPRWAFAPTDSSVPDGDFNDDEILRQAQDDNGVGQNDNGVGQDDNVALDDNGVGQDDNVALDDNGVGQATVSVFAENLEIPWAMDWLPDGSMLVTERPGRLLALGADGSRRGIAFPEAVAQVGEGGLLGVALHPGFAETGWIYVYRTTTAGEGTVNVVERYVLSEDLVLSERKAIVEGIPGAQYHDGGALKFGPDGFLYITTGDASQSDLAQDLNSLAGKILRVDEDGGIADGNPFGTRVFSYGHRNPQGLAFDREGRLWSTEHGRSGLQSGLDEVNVIESGVNYGWPVIEGDEGGSDMRRPVIHSGEDETWAPASAAILGERLLFGGLRGQSLYAARLENTSAVDLRAYLREDFGRLRAVAVGPDGFVYVSTSNQDGRGEVGVGDDKILRIDPRLFDG